MFRKCLTGRPYPRATRETQLSPSILNFHILVMCRAHASFRGKLSRELPAKTLQSSIYLSLHTLSLSHTHTQPLQLNPTINTGYKRLNKITIKFGTELKQTKYIVVNYKFTVWVCYFGGLFFFFWLLVVMRLWVWVVMRLWVWVCDFSGWGLWWLLASGFFFFFFFLGGGGWQWLDMAVAVVCLDWEESGGFLQKKRET